MRATFRRMSEAIIVRTPRLFDARHLGEGLPGMTLYRRADPAPGATAPKVAAPISGDMLRSVAERRLSV